MIKAIFFDMDGVLVDTPSYAAVTINKLLEKYNIFLSDTDFKEYHGMATSDRVKLWNKKYNVNIDEQEFSDDFISTQMQLMKHELIPNKEIISLLEKLKKKYKIALATSSLRIKANEILKRLELTNFMDLIIAADDVQKHKPDPEIYLVTADKLRFPPSECVVIEDSIKGIQSGQAANMKVIALKTIHFSEQDLAIADSVIENLTELADLLL